jgi:LacI family transcriptional regulator
MLAALSRYRRQPRREKFQATLAWVTNFPERGAWRQEEIFAEYHGGAKERAAQLGFRLQEFWLREDRMTAARASQILAARGIAGLVLAPQPTPAEAVELEWERFVAVTIGYSLVRPQLHMVCPNQYRCMKLAMEELVRRDYRRIGLVMLRESDERVDHNWLAGYFVGQQALAPGDRLEPLLLPEWNEKLLGAWLRRGRPDALVSKCAQTLSALRRLGYELPRDLGLASLTRVRSTRDLAGVDESPQEVGAAAVDYLAGMLQRNERGVPRLPRRLLIEGRWCEGGTLRPPPSAAP